MMTLTQAKSVVTSVLSHIHIGIGVDLGGNTSHKFAVTHCDTVIACMCLLLSVHGCRRLLMHVLRKRIASWTETVHISDIHHSWKASYAFTSIHANGSAFTPWVQPHPDVRNGLQFSDWHIMFQIILLVGKSCSHERHLVMIYV